ncbi:MULTISPECIES: hypothetical protein [unclassified Acinetobacter]|uniref:hypothetical protein n=1 Tax=unclassified Acinetobacter TaxID=196816 RepID=UPI0015D38308|nr:MULTISPECIES: hypothetical protein [unclassified Acinetobacter]
MKKIILLVLFLLSASVQAQKIYVSNDANNDASSDREAPIELKYKTYRPEWSPLDWNYSCSRDKFSGKKSCSLNKSHSNIMVSIFDGRYSVYIGRNHFPRTQSAIKIDNNAPIYGYEGSSNTPQKVIEQMKKGKVAYTRYKEWPYEYNQDGETDLTGFTEKYNEMLEEYKKL